MNVRVLPMGEHAVIAEVGSLAEVLDLRAALAATPLDGVVDLVPAARTVLVRLDPRLPASRARAWIERTAAVADAAARVTRADPVELDIAYDGVDLSDVAALLELSAAGLVARHSQATWTVAFTGFAPGFAYLVSADWPFEVPRHPVPRTRIPAGSFGLAGEFSGAYPRDTPGGWQLIGTTRAPLFDPHRAEPALLVPGARVRLRVLDGRASATLSTPPPSPAPAPNPAPQSPAPSSARAFTVIEPGLLATVQDLGRPGRASQGIARSGALDRAALRTANRLVGNPEGAAAIEATIGGFAAVATADLWFAVTGAWGPVAIDGVGVDPFRAQLWPAGAELRLDWFEHGARAYVAIRGGIDAPIVAGARSSDMLAGLGAGQLRAGDVLSVRDDADAPIPVLDVAPWGAPPDDDVEIELAPGPRDDWFDASARDVLYGTVWTVGGAADRVGIRLDGPEIPRANRHELPSEGMVPGAIQVPPSGRPTVLLADGPVTGGYPVIAVVTDASLDALAQVTPGTRIRFRHAHAHSHSHA